MAGLRVLFIDQHDGKVTAVIQVRYAGPAEKFAWLVPVRGMVEVAVSSNTLFDRLETATVPEYWLEVGADGQCMKPDAGPNVEPGTGPVIGPMMQPVSAGDQGTVGPYDYASLGLSASADRVAAASEWLDRNGYAVTELET